MIIPIEVNLTKDSQKDGNGETETAGIAANAEVNVITKITDDDFELEGIELNCFGVEGNFGPLTIAGGLNVIRSDSAAVKWGDGFKAGLEVTFGKQKEENGLTTGAQSGFKVVAQFGKTRYDRSKAEAEVVNGQTTGKQKAYRYFFFDLEATFPGTGFALPPPSPSSAPVVYVVGGGGGFLYNMDIAPSDYIFSNSDKSKEIQNLPDNNDCKVNMGVTGKYLKPGVSLSGTVYEPSNGEIGGNLMVILTTLPGNAPAQLLAGDLTLRVGLHKNDAGTIGFSYVQVDGNAYVNPKSVPQRREENSATINASVKYDHRSRVLDGTLKVAAAFPNTPANLRKILADKETKRRAILKDESKGRKQRFAEVIALNKEQNAAIEKEANRDKLVIIKNAVARAAVDFKQRKWGFKLGSWGDGGGQEPSSGLPYSEVTFPVLADLAVKFYLQFGHDVDGIPPIAELLPSWNTLATPTDGATRNDDLYNKGNGMVMGAVAEISTEKSMGPLSGYLNAKVGFDVSLIKYSGIKCGDSEGEIGLNGWYARGQAYAFGKARLDLEYDFTFKSGKVNIFDAEAAAYVTAQLPNPTYITGFIKGRYSVLDGLLDGDFNYQFEAGEQCASLAGKSKVTGIPLIQEVYPSATDNKNVKVFATPRLVTNWRLGSVISFPNLDEDGKVKDYDSYQARLAEFSIYDEQDHKLAGLIRMDEDNKGASLDLGNYLQENTNYRLYIKAEWYVDKGDKGKFERLYEDGAYVVEDTTVNFTTGPFPEKIYKEMLESQTPGYRQRYWHPGYARPQLRFNTHDPQLKNLFPETVVIDEEETRYEYIARINQVGPDAKKDVFFEVPVTKYPGSKLFKKAVRDEIAYGTYFRIPIIKNEDVTVNEVSFPDMDGLKLEGGAVYKFNLIRRPERSTLAEEPEVYVNGGFQNLEGQNTIEAKLITVEREGSRADSAGFGTFEVLESEFDKNSQGGTASTNKNLNSLDREVEKEIAANTKILYEYHFGVSRYRNLAQKIEGSAVRFIPTKLKRTDLSHPKNATFSWQKGNWDSKNADAFKTKDDYFAFTPGRDEGFDQFDLDRIRLNAQVSYVDQFRAYEEYQKQVCPSDYSINSVFRTNYDQYFAHSSHPSNKRTFLKAVLKPYSRITLSSSNGTAWNYDFHIPPRMKELTDDDIDKGRTYYYPDMRSKRDGSTTKEVFEREERFGLLFQDIQSRIVSNQIRLIADVGYTEITTHTTDGTTWQEVKGFFGGDDGDRSYSGSLDREIEGYTSYHWYNTVYAETRKMWFDAGYNAGSPHYFKGDWGMGRWAANAQMNAIAPLYRDGYAWNYHGNIKLKFPRDASWQEMNSRIENPYGHITTTLTPKHKNDESPDQGVAQTEVKDGPPSDLSALYELQWHHAGSEKKLTKVKLKAKWNGTPQPDYVYVFYVIKKEGSFFPIGYITATFNRSTSTWIVDKTDDYGQTSRKIKILSGEELHQQEGVDLWPAFDTQVTGIPKDKLRIDHLSDPFVFFYFNGKGVYGMDAAAREKYDQDDNVPISKYELKGGNPYTGPIEKLAPEEEDGVPEPFGNHFLPFQGLYQNFPGPVALEKYDWGGPGISYNDARAGNAKGSFRSNEDVDLLLKGSTYALAEMEEGEFVQYALMPPYGEPVREGLPVPIGQSAQGLMEGSFTYRSSRSVDLEMSLGGEKIAVLKLPSSRGLNQAVKFSFLPNASANLLQDNSWSLILSVAKGKLDELSDLSFQKASNNEEVLRPAPNVVYRIKDEGGSYLKTSIEGVNLIYPASFGSLYTFNEIKSYYSDNSGYNLYDQRGFRIAPSRNAIDNRIIPNTKLEANSFADFHPIYFSDAFLLKHDIGVKDRYLKTDAAYTYNNPNVNERPRLRLEKVKDLDNDSLRLDFMINEDYWYKLIFSPYGYSKNAGMEYLVAIGSGGKITSSRSGYNSFSLEIRFEKVGNGRYLIYRKDPADPQKELLGLPGIGISNEKPFHLSTEPGGHRTNFYLNIADADGNFMYYSSGLDTKMYVHWQNLTEVLPQNDLTEGEKEARVPVDADEINRARSQDEFILRPVSRIGTNGKLW
ncbi:MAG: hypothetical protein AAF206_05205 [Bacteroidota bacterium]